MGCVEADPQQGIEPVPVGSDHAETERAAGIVEHALTISPPLDQSSCDGGRGSDS